MASDAYLRIDRIKGESADLDHQGWLEVSGAHLVLCNQGARQVLIVATLALCSLSQAADKPETQTSGWKPLKGDYLIYGGELGDTVPPTKKDRKVAFTVTEPLAKDLFDQIGPDRKDACGAAADHRIRERADLSCVWDKRDGYICHFGLDVPTGKSTYGSIC